MQIEPAVKEFAARYAARSPQVVWTTLVADLETPVSAFLKVTGARPKRAFSSDALPASFLLESVEGGSVRGRYSIIGLEPDLIYRTNGRSAEVNATHRQTRRDLRRPQSRRLGPCGLSSRKAGLRCRTGCRQWPRGCSGTWAMTPFG